MGAVLAESGQMPKDAIRAEPAGSCISWSGEDQLARLARPEFTLALWMFKNLPWLDENASY